LLNIVQHTITPLAKLDLCDALKGELGVRLHALAIGVIVTPHCDDCCFRRIWDH
jgi:hypothetical protein